MESGGVCSESAASVSVASESVPSLSVSTRVLSGGGISCPDTGNIVKNSEMQEKITATDLKFDNEYYFCNIRIAYKIN